MNNNLQFLLSAFLLLTPNYLCWFPGNTVDFKVKLEQEQRLRLPDGNKSNSQTTHQVHSTSSEAAAAEAAILHHSAALGFMPCMLKRSLWELQWIISIHPSSISPSSYPMESGGATRSQIIRVTHSIEKLQYYIYSIYSIYSISPLIKTLLCGSSSPDRYRQVLFVCFPGSVFPPVTVIKQEGDEDWASTGEMSLPREVNKRQKR